MPNSSDRDHALRTVNLQLEVVESEIRMQEKEVVRPGLSRDQDKRARRFLELMRLTREDFVARRDALWRSPQHHDETLSQH